MHDYVIMVKVGNSPARVYGIFDAWHKAYTYRNTRIPKGQRAGALILPVNGIG